MTCGIHQRCRNVLANQYSETVIVVRDWNKFSSYNNTYTYLKREINCILQAMNSDDVYERDVEKTKSFQFSCCEFSSYYETLNGNYF